MKHGVVDLHERLTGAGVVAAIEMVPCQPGRQDFQYVIGPAGTVGLQEGFWNACDCLDDTFRGHPILWRNCKAGGMGRTPGTQHRPFIDWHVECLPLPPDLAVEPPALGFQLLACPQQRGVATQMQHGRCPDTPRVFCCWPLFTQDGHATIDRLGQCCSP